MTRWCASGTAGVALLLTPVLAAAGTVLHVSPAGDDANPGTEERPFATPRRAQSAVRELTRAGLREPVTVRLAGGTYELSEPLVFGPEDGGTAEFPVTYLAAPGEGPVLSGGRRIAGWRPGPEGVWTAPVPGAREGTWLFRQLWVNGRRATRARFPDADALPPCFQLTGARLAEDLSSHTYSFPAGVLAPWRNLSDVEAVVFGNWEITRKRFETVDAAAGVAHMAGPHTRPHEAMMPEAGRWCYLENAREFLDRPGEWYLDRAAGLVAYWPRPGEDLTQAEVTAPVLTRILEVRGEPGRPVRNLHFAGLTIAFTDWPLPPGGYLGLQASHFVTGRAWNEAAPGRVEAAVRWDDADQCSFRDGALQHLGGAALELNTRCTRNVIEGNWVTDVSANGINLGGPRGETEVPRDTRIANNRIHACGVDYHGSVGVWVGLAQQTVIAHNLIHDLPYTGVSVGWQWNPDPTPARENTVEYNHIHDVMKRLGDGGGIYTLGFQPGSVIRGNHIHDVRRSQFAQAAPNNGIFFDEGSSGFRVEGNVIYATTGEPIRFNQTSAEALTWGPNRFGLRQLAPGKVGAALRCDGSTSFVEIPHAPELDPPELTAEAWFRIPEFATEGDTRQWLVNKNDDEWTEGHWGLVTNRDRLGAYLNIGGGQDNTISAWSPPGALSEGAWHHGAFTFDGRDLRVYLDGREVAAAAVNRPRTPGTLPLAIGRRQDGHTCFRGDLDEVRLYSRALTAAEVAARAASGGAPPPAGLPEAGHWGFDDKPDDSLEAIAAAEKAAGPEPAFRQRLGLEP